MGKPTGQIDRVFPTKTITTRCFASFIITVRSAHICNLVTEKQKCRAVDALDAYQQVLNDHPEALSTPFNMFSRLASASSVRVFGLGRFCGGGLRVAGRARLRGAARGCLAARGGLAAAAAFAAVATDTCNATSRQTSITMSLITRIFHGLRRVIEFFEEKHRVSTRSTKKSLTFP